MISGGPNIEDESLIMYLDPNNQKCYHGSGTDLNNLVSSDYNASLINSLSIVSENGGGFDFDGIDDRIDFDTLITGFENLFTYETWIYGDGGSNNWSRLFVNGTVNTSVTITKYNNTSGILYRLNQGGTWHEYNLPTGTLRSSGWVYLTFSYDGIIMRAYINGSEYGVGNTINATISSASSGVAAIGGQVGSSTILAKISTCRLYNRVLTSQEILNNFNQQKSRFGL